MNDIPIFRVYLRIVCEKERDSVEIQTLSSNAIEFEKLVKGNIYVKFGHSKGESVFSQINIGFHQVEYDLDLFDENINTLFDNLLIIKLLLKEMSDKIAPSFQFMININLSDNEQRPCFYIPPELLKLLSDLDASLELDGYVHY